MNEPLRTYCIYERPRDFPDNYVVRAWDIVSGVAAPVRDWNLKLAATLEGARALIPAGKVNIGRMDGDDPAIYEVWV